MQEMGICNMTDEIKGILDYLKNNTFIPDETKRKYKILHRDEVKILLDYITNLEQENERLKEWKEDLLKENIELENIRKEAIEYIENDMPYLEEPDDEYENNHKMIEYDKSILLNILENGSKDE